MFSIAFDIGQNVKVTDLPGPDDERLSKLKAGYTINGWKLSKQNGGDVERAVKTDAEGYVQSFYMSTLDVYLYAGELIPSKNTPYTIIYKIQNKALDDYEEYKRVTKKGTTSTPEDISMTKAAANLIDIKGFAARTDLINEAEILADGSTVVEVLYDRNTYVLTLHSNVTPAEETFTQNFYYDVPLALMKNTFENTGHYFLGWATSRSRADSKKVDYNDEEVYTIGNGDSDLYAVWELPEVNITIELPTVDEVGIRYEITSDTIITFYAVIPEGHNVSDYTFSWYRKGDSLASLPESQKYSNWVVDTAGWAAGTYEITLIAVYKDGMPSGGTIQIVITQ